MQICVGSCAPACARCESIQGLLGRLGSGLDIRTWICPACGTIGCGEASLSELPCAECGVKTPLPPRTTAGDPGSRPEYDFTRPPESDRALQWREPTDETLRALVVAYADALSGSKDVDAGYRAAAGIDVATEHRLAWLGARIDDVLSHQERSAWARPFLETVVDRARDDGFRLRALLRLARQHEDWLAFCPDAASDPALAAALRERRAFHALQHGQEPITDGFDTYPLAWPEQLGLCLARVMQAEHADKASMAEARLEATLGSHLEADVAAAVQREPVLAGIRGVWGRIAEKQRKRALLPVKATWVVSGLLLALAFVSLLAAQSYRMECWRTANEDSVDCVVHEHVGGFAAGTRQVDDVTGAAIGRAGKNSRRVELVTKAGRVVVDSASDVDAEHRKQRIDRAIQQREARFVERWDHDAFLLASIIGAVTALFMALLALGQYARIRLRSAQSVAKQ